MLPSCGFFWKATPSCSRKAQAPCTCVVWGVLYVWRHSPLPSIIPMVWPWPSTTIQTQTIHLQIVAQEPDVAESTRIRVAVVVAEVGVGLRPVVVGELQDCRVVFDRVLSVGCLENRYIHMTWVLAPTESPSNLPTHSPGSCIRFITAPAPSASGSDGACAPVFKVRFPFVVGSFQCGLLHQSRFTTCIHPTTLLNIHLS